MEPFLVADPDAAAAYRHVLQTLNAGDLPYLVGGAFAFAAYTGIERPTRDLDLFIRASDYGCIADALIAAGFPTELTYPHWLGKVHAGGSDIDLIFNSGNGMAVVDDLWFDHATPGTALGEPVRLMPVEEMIWSKAFVMERERYDGADVAHLLRDHAATLDWPRLLERVGPHWRVLLSHLVLFGFIYPSERQHVPAPVMTTLLDRLRHEMAEPPPPTPLCRGTLISREQYLHDVEVRGDIDARVTPASSMTPADVARWTAAIPDRRQATPDAG